MCFFSPSAEGESKQSLLSRFSTKNERYARITALLILSSFFLWTTGGARLHLRLFSFGTGRLLGDVTLITTIAVMGGVPSSGRLLRWSLTNESRNTEAVEAISSLSNEGLTYVMLVQYGRLSPMS